jgi:hypothetical protein
MSGRSLPTALGTAFQQGYVQWFPLVEMQLDSGPVRFCGAPFDVVHAGNTYSTLFGLGSIEPIVETDTTQNGLSFVLSGAPDAAIAIALGEQVQGRAVTVRLAVVVEGALVVDESTWQGLLDVMAFEDGQPPQVRVSAEHQLIAWDEPSGLMFTHADQQALHPGDLFFEYQASLVDATIVWPTAEALRG